MEVELEVFLFAHTIIVIQGVWQWRFDVLKWTVVVWE